MVTPRCEPPQHLPTLPLLLGPQTPHSLGDWDRGMGGAVLLFPKLPPPPLFVGSQMWQAVPTASQHSWLCAGCPEWAPSRLFQCLGLLALLGAQTCPPHLCLVSASPSSVS